MSTTISIAKSDHFSAEVVVDLGQKIATIRFMGSLDERTPLKEIAGYIFRSKSDFTRFSFDLFHIDYLNSVGIEAWVQFLEQLQGKIVFEFENLSEVVVEKAGMLGTILGNHGTKVRNFSVPYYCEACDQRVPCILSTQSFSNSQGNFTAPPAQCPHCKKAMKFDEVEKVYFSFLKRVFRGSP